jgi:hypothetical protein
MKQELYAPAGAKLGHSMLGCRLGAAALAVGLIGGCATTAGDPVSEKLDPDTATTVTTLSKPIELFSEAPRGHVNDPFAYIAPFETDRQGERALFLWVSAPQTRGVLGQPQVLCNGQPLSLEPLSNDGPPVATDSPGTPPGPAATTGPVATTDTASVKVDWSQLNLSRAPYEAPVPWSAQWYFRLPQDGMDCLAGAQGISLETRAPDGDEERFTVERKNFAALDAFTRR